MNGRISVSAIVPTFNRGYVVGKAVESILNQTYDNIEVIVVDDGSTDNTQEVLREYGKRIRVVSQTNCGPSAARNHGIRVSRGEIIAFLDSDDIWLPNKIERQVSLLGQTSTYVPCCLCNGIQVFRGAGESNLFEKANFKPTCSEGIWLNVMDILSTRFVLFNQLVAIRRDALSKIGCFDESLRFLEDYDLSLRLSIEGPWGFIQEPLAIINSTSADSLALKISKEEVSHEQYMLKTRERVFATASGRGRSGKTLKYLRRAIRKSRRDLVRAKLRSSNVWWKQVLGNLLKGFERLRMATFRRSPWFPKFEAVPIESEKEFHA